MAPAEVLPSHPSEALDVHVGGTHDHNHVEVAREAAFGEAEGHSYAMPGKHMSPLRGGGGMCSLRCLLRVERVPCALGAP